MAEVDAQAFVEIWQASSSIDEVLRRMGAARGQRRTIIRRAARYRSNGVPLKHMPGGFKKKESLDWEGLAAYAETLKGDA